MSTVRLLVWIVIVIASLPAHAQFTLKLSPVSPGTAELQFSRTPGYYYRLEKSTDLNFGFSEASGWMLGDDSLATWPIQYSTSSPESGGSGTTNLIDTFTLYPFGNGKTLVRWSDSAGASSSALVVQDYSTLPPLISLPVSSSGRGLLLLGGSLAWNYAYETLHPEILPQEQQTVLARLTTRHAEILAASTGNASGPGLVVPSQKNFFRLRRMATDADGDGLDWATEVFQYGTDPDKPDTDGDEIWDSDEISVGTDPLNPFNGQPPIITQFGGDGQIAWANAFLPEEIAVRVQNQDRTYIAGYPVPIFVNHGQVSLTSDGTAMLGSSPVLRTDEDGFVHFYVRHDATFNTDCHVSVEIDYGVSQLWLSYTSRILGNPNGIAAPHDLDGAYNAAGGYTITWQNSPGTAEIVIERSLDDESHYEPVARLPATATQWTDPHPLTAIMPRPPGVENVYYRPNSTH